jgi:hypothetical protein
MTISKAALKAIAEAKGGRESFKVILAALVDDQTITKEVAGRVGLALDAHPELDEAIKDHAASKSRH